MRKTIDMFVEQQDIVGFSFFEATEGWLVK